MRSITASVSDWSLILRERGWPGPAGVHESDSGQVPRRPIDATPPALR